MLGILRRASIAVKMMGTGATSEYTAAETNRYIELAQRVTEPRFRFMNMGYATPGVDEDYSWLKDEDFESRYNIGLIQKVLDGTDLVGRRVLDIGCGRGGPASFIARYRDAERVVGLDLCQPGIEFCQTIYAGIENLSFVVGDALNLPFEADSFDVICNIDSSHAYPDLGKFYSEVHRVLRPGGRFCYADFSVRGLGWLRVKKVKEYDFRVLAVSDLTKGVSHALTLNKENLARLMEEIIAKDPANRALVESYERMVNVRLARSMGHWRSITRFVNILAELA
ncbi:MAG: class I SAM-dependent methyltransferase [Gemmatimonadota bacterium]|nr:MAG: class I SAM-dependent methyltransferase [Gemmatimonadota bacterium]